jgi:FlaG/FlaF family flagellin (archaellin)
MATTKIDTLNIEDEAIELAQVNTELRKGIITVTHPGTVSAGGYTVLLSAPFNFTITQVVHAVSNASHTLVLKVQIEGVNVLFDDNAASTETDMVVNDTIEAQAADSLNTGEVGDVISIDVSSLTTTPENLTVQLEIQRTS